MHPRVPRELVGVAAEPLSVLSGKPWQPGEVSFEWKRGKLIPFLRGEKGKELSLASAPSKIREQILLETLPKPMGNKEVIGDGERGFAKGRWCPTNLVAFCNGVTALVGRGGTEIS